MSELQSPQFQAYLRRNKKRKRLIWVTRALLLVLFIFLWEVSTFYHWVDSMLTGAPSKMYLKAESFIIPG
jgi:ABC-type nitrate/sulfonate/bicarbonate transport system permease component